MFSKIAIIMTLCSIMLFGCNEQKTKTITFPSDVGVITAIIESNEPSEHNGGNDTLIYGKLVFPSNIKLPVIVNLKCISLSMGEIGSENIYIGSFVDVLAEAVKISSEDAVISVYWVIKEKVNGFNQKPKIYIHPKCHFIDN